MCFEKMKHIKVTTGYKIYQTVIWHASHPVYVLTALLCFASIDQPLPELGRDAGDVEGAGDG